MSLSKEKLTAIRKDYVARLKVIYIAAVHGVHPSTVQKVARRTGVKRRPWGRPRKGGKTQTKKTIACRTTER
jgi:uncharacterized protein YjcR